MIRRTLAIAGAAVLTAGVTGLAGPAAADPGAGITANGDILLNEVGAELDSNSPDHGITGGLIELVNNGATNVQIGGFVVEGCTSSDPTFRVEIPGTIELAPGETYLVGDFDYASDPFDPSPPDQRFASGEVLEQVEGGAALLESLTATEPMDEVAWGVNADVECADPDANAGVIPNDHKSINRNLVNPTDDWSLATPTPEGLGV